MSTTADIPLDHLHSLLKPITVPRHSARFTNWGRSYTCLPAELFEPENEFHCQLILELAKRDGKTLRAIGVGHSPSDLPCTNGYMIRMTKLNQVLEVDTDKCLVTVQAGITLKDLHAQLAQRDLAMSSVGSISDQTLGGVIVTATHGSGLHFGVISTTVKSLTLLLADGSCQVCSRGEKEEDLFLATLCGLGATGIILSAQLQVERAFKLKEIQTSLGFEDLVMGLGEHVKRSEHVRFWWYPTKDIIRASYCDRTQEVKKPTTTGTWLWHIFDHHVIQFLLFLGRYFLPLNSVAADLAYWLNSGNSEGVDDSYKIFNINVRYPQYTTEWAFPHENARPFLTEFRDYLRKEYENSNGLRPHFPVEIRFSAPDDIWLSPSYGRPTCWVGIVQYKPYGFPVPYRSLFNAFESIAIRHGGRPHWAKTHPFTPNEFRKVYSKFDDFIAVMERVDPLGVWRNEYIERHLVGKMGENMSWRVFKKRK